MRLLVVKDCDLETGHLALSSFVGGAVPPYATFSHRWLTDEVQYRDIERHTAISRTGYAKVKGAILQARQDGHDFLWIDMCCIDDSSSAELSEVINSMWDWYKNATTCYAYLSDVNSIPEEQAFESEFASSLWFTRGWTLQELLAPRNVSFFNRSWKLLGTKRTLQNLVSTTTGIENEYLINARPLSQASVAKRMSWAAHRKTLRPEDIAYCLMGIFSVNMPLVYGEGNKAFLRLQEEILQSSDDESLFAWLNPEANPDDKHGLLADHPKHFQHSRDVYPIQGFAGREPSKITNRGLSIQQSHVNNNQMSLFCQYQGRAGYLTINITRLERGLDQYARVQTGSCSSCPRIEKLETLYFPQVIPDSNRFMPSTDRSLKFLLRVSTRTRQSGFYREKGRVDGLHPVKSGEIRSNGTGWDITTHSIPKQGTHAEVLIHFERPSDGRHLIVMLGSYNTTEPGYAVSEVEAGSIYEMKAESRSRKFAHQMPDTRRPKRVEGAYAPVALGSRVEVGESHAVSVKRVGPRFSNHLNKQVDLLEVDIEAIDEPPEMQRSVCSVQ